VSITTNGTGGEGVTVQIMGVAPVGASNLRGVTVAAAPPPPAPAPPIAPDSAQYLAEQRIVVETVVLPKERWRTDARPDELRRRQAAARYTAQEPGTDPDTAGPAPPHRHA
jgi:hypothetical protein